MKTPDEYDPKTEAAKILASLTNAAIAYAGNAARGNYRGFAALHDLCDANMILPGAEELEAQDDAALELWNTTMSEVSALLIAHPAAQTEEKPLAKGDAVCYAMPADSTEAEAVFCVLLSEPDRIQMRWVNSGMPIAPIETVEPAQVRRAFNVFHRAERLIRLDIRKAYALMQIATRGTTDYEAAFSCFVELQKELGALELARLAIR